MGKKGRFTGNPKLYRMLAAGLILACTQIAGTAPSAANDDLLRGIIGIGGAILQHEINRQSRPEPAYRQPSPDSGRQAPARQARASEPRLSPDQVYAVQLRLNAMGYDAGRPDGGLGANTRRGIRQWQSATGHAPTGYLSQAQAAILLEGGAEAIEAAAGRDGQLLPSQIQQMQSRLNALGYDAGSPDGVAGPRTREAVSRFLRDRGHDPDAISARSALDLVTGSGATAGGLAVTGTAGLGPATPNGADEIAAVDLSGIEFERLAIDSGNGNPTLIRMMVAARPELLDDDEILAALFRREGNRHSSSYRVAEELADFKSSYLASPAPERAFVTLVENYGLVRSGYSVERQIFPFRETGIMTAGLGRFTTIDTPSLRNARLNLAIPSLPSLSGIPMSLEEAEAFEREEFGHRKDLFVTVEARVEIANLTYNAGNRMFEADTRLFSVEARPMERRGGNEPLHVWSIDAPPSPEPREPGVAVAFEQLAAMYPDLAVADGHLDVLRSTGIGPLAASLMLAVHPDAYENDLLLAAAGNALLSGAEKQDIWRGSEPRYWSWGELRSEEQHRISHFAASIRERHAGTLSDRTIDPSIRIMETIEVRLASGTEDDSVTLDYDYDGTVSLEDEHDFARIEWSHPAVVLPRSASADSPLARAVSERFGQDIADQRLYMVIYSEVAGVSVEGFSDRRQQYVVDVRPKVTRIALYFDRERTRLAHDFYADPESRLLREQREQDRIAALLSEDRAGLDILHVAFARLSGDSQYLPGIVADTLAEQDVNEFERADAERELLVRLQEAALSSDLILDWNIPLGTYDLNLDAFTVAGPEDSFTRISELNAAASAHGIEPGSLRVDIVNRPRSLAVQRDPARRLVERIEAEGSRRVIRAVVTAEPVSAKVTVDRHDRTYQHLGLHIRRMVLLAGNRNRLTGYEIIGEVDYGPYRPAEIAGVDQVGGWSDLPLLDQEMAAVLALRNDGTELKDSVLRRLFGDRWLREQNRGFPSGASVSIFGDAAQVPSVTAFDQSRDQFREWMKARARTDPPETVRIRMALAGWGGETMLPGQCSDMRAITGGGSSADREAVDAALGVDMWDYERELSAQMGRGSPDEPAVLENVMFTFVYPSLVDCVVPQAADVAGSLTLGQDAMASPAYVLVDRLPIPRNYAQEGYSYGTLDLVIEDVRPIGGTQGSQTMLIRGSFRDVSYMKEDADVTASQPDMLSWSPADIVRKSIDLDILGLRLGMPETEAAELVREHLGEDMIVLRSRPDRSPAVPEFSDVTFYLKADRTERLALYFEEGKGTRDVLAVERIVSAPDWKFPRDQVANGVISKYGEPVHADFGQYGTQLAWGPGAGTYECQRFDNGGELISHWVDQDGNPVELTDFIEWNLARDSTIAFVPEMFNPDQVKHCTGILLFSHGVNSFSTLLVDPGEYILAWRATQALNEAKANAPSAGASNSGGLGVRF